VLWPVIFATRAIAAREVLQVRGARVFEGGRVSCASSCMPPVPVGLRTALRHNPALTAHRTAYALLQLPPYHGYTAANAERAATFGLLCSLAAQVSPRLSDLEIDGILRQRLNFEASDMRLWRPLLQRVRGEGSKEQLCATSGSVHLGLPPGTPPSHA
jgi:hypothetical protein